MIYASVLITDGAFQFDRVFASFSEAADYSRANNCLIVSEPIARMLNGRKTTSHDTPNFQHFNEDGEFKWYYDPEEYARRIFSAVTSIEISAEEPAAAKRPDGVYVRGAQVLAGPEGDAALLAVYGERGDGAARVRVLPSLYFVEWWDEDQLLSAPPLDLPSQKFFNDYLTDAQRLQRN